MNTNLSRKGFFSGYIKKIKDMQQSFCSLHICEEPAFCNNSTWTSIPLNLHLDDRIKSIDLLR